MNTKLLVSSVAAAVALSALAYVQFDRPEPVTPANTPAIAPRAAGRDVAAIASNEREPSSSRELVAAVVPDAVERVSEEEDQGLATGEWVLRGRVVDTEGSPMGGVELVVEGEPESFASMSGGGFETSTELDQGHVVPAPATRAEWVAVHQAFFQRGSQLEPVVVVAHAIVLGGRVVDEFGAPVSGAHLELALPGTLDVVLGRVLDATRSPRFAGSSNAYGEFELRGVPSVVDADWHITAEGYERTVIPAPTADDTGLTIVLAQPRVPLEGSLAGRVVDRSGAPVRGARVAVGVTATLTDRAGEFRLDLSAALTADRIVAVKSGYIPAIQTRSLSVDADELEEDPLAGWPNYVELQLGGPPLTIRGRVVASDGTPVASAKVWTPDGTHFGMLGKMPTTIENLMAGADVPPEAFARKMPERDDPQATHGMHSNAREPSAFWNWIETDDRGDFELAGLIDKEYRLTAMDTSSLQEETTQPIAAGARGVRITLPTESVHRKFSGRVVTDRGRPVAGVRVTLQREPYFVRARFFGGVAEASMIENRETVTTGADGRFELEDVPREGMRLSLRADAIVPREEEVPSELRAGGVDVVVDARCHLRVALGGFGDEADQVCVVDDLGNILPLMQISEGSVTSKTYFPLVNGETGVLSASSRGRKLRVMQGQRVLAEIALDLFPGAVTVVRP